ncbi:MAG: DUF4157 domain-containing protein [Chloroflexi bacterium]|nr:DUF4157 domain-containing protein [Chloroflexota bacterium]
MAKNKLLNSIEKDQKSASIKAEQTHSQVEQDDEEQGIRTDTAFPPLSRAEAIFELQQTYGNQYVRGLVEHKEEITDEKSDSAIASQARSMHGQGKSLPGSMRERAENRLGENLESVRVHTYPEADRLITEAGSPAFTVGQDIFLRENILDNGESDILAHEVVHTIQQKYGSVSDPEYEAENAGQRVLKGESVYMHPGQRIPVPALQRYATKNGNITVHQPTYTDFEVTGTLSRVKMALDARGEWGKCSWYFVEDTPGDSNGTILKCHLDVSNEIFLPKWTGPGFEKAPPAAVKEFNRMLGCLKKHEVGHAKKAEADAPNFQKYFIGKNNADIDTLHQEALDKHKADVQDPYDEKNSHGADEGVSLNTDTDPKRTQAGNKNKPRLI